MEPRVSNLLLLERLPAERHGADLHTTSSNPHGALFPSATLPAIRPLLHEDQGISARPYSNEIDSLTLPEIDWEALNIVLDPPPPAALPASSLSVPTETPASNPKRPAKSGAPLAEVLNANSPEVRNARIQDEFTEPEARKKRRLDGPVTRTLPRPSPATKKNNNKRHPLLPPLLVPLHEPPPDAGLIPSMATEGFRERLDKIPSREALRVENNASPPSPPLPPPPAPPGSTSTEKPTDKPDEPKSTQAAKNRRVRHSWTDVETADLLRGVAKFGIGSWKKILDHPEYKFNGRTAVDLKDRFRTICPDEYRKSGAEKGQQTETTSTNTATKKSKKKPSVTIPENETATRTESNKLPEELARLGISGPFPKSQRRARRGFTAEEDEALLRGFEKFGARWTKIQSDMSLGLASRSRTDLRDRFRNKYPEKFIETGHKFKLKEGEASKDLNEPEKEDLEALPEEPLSSTTTNGNQRHAPSTTAPDISEPPHPLRLLTSSMAAPPYFNELGDITPDDDVPATITLSRNIFEWADQNTARIAASRAENTTAANLELSATITTMDELLLDPMLANRLPHHPFSAGPNSMRDAAVAAPSNLFPQLPLSGILNGPVSLPSAAELVSGVEAEGRFD